MLLGGRRRPVVGRIAMDQFLVDVGDAPSRSATRSCCSATRRRGAPSADDWADAADTIGYEIVTRIGPRVPRRYLGDA